MRCDLHVHSFHSGAINQPVLRHFGRDSYSDPEAVYETARRRGMDLVTLTDHDTIDGALALAGRPDTFFSEEVTCRLPEGRELHVGVFGIDERQHARIARLRLDAEALFAYLAAQRLPACVNHPFSALTGRRETVDLERAFARLPLVEARNGMMPAGTNRYAEEAARRHGRPVVGGSDGHTLRAVAQAWTEVPGARTREEFLDGLRRGACRVGGTVGSTWRLTANVLRVAAAGYREAARQAPGSLDAAVRFGVLVAAAPVFLLVPVVSLAIQAHERHFAGRTFRRFTEATLLPRGRALVA